VLFPTSTTPGTTIDGVSGAITGALAATGAGAVVQGMVSGLVSGAASVANDKASGKDINWTRAVNSAALGFATGYMGGAGVRANPAVKNADRTCLKVLNKVQSGAYATVRGAKSAMTQAINRLNKVLTPVVVETTLLFTRSSVLSAVGMSVYDSINER